MVYQWWINVKIEGFKPVSSQVPTAITYSLNEGSQYELVQNCSQRTDDRDNPSSLGWLCVCQCQKIRGEVELENMSGVYQGMDRALVCTMNMMN
jgi:hypothetical protein